MISLIPKVATRLETGLTADCTELDIDPAKKILLQTRPAFGGNIMATIICPSHRPQMATVRHKVMKEAPFDRQRKGEIIKKEVDPRKIPLRTEVIEIITNLEETVLLEEADIIVSGRECGNRAGRRYFFDYISLRAVKNAVIICLEFQETSRFHLHG